MPRFLSALLLPVLLMAPVAGQADAPAPAPAGDPRLPLAEIRRFVSVFNAVRAAYVEPVDEKALMQAAVRGLLLDLDPHSVYFDAEDARSFNERATGSYEGIGVEVQTQEDRTLKVIAPIEGGPAEKAGVLAGDLIVQVDGKDLAQLNESEPLRGPAGTMVRLGIRRGDQEKLVEVAVQRQTIQVSSLRSRWLEPGYAYLRITNFQADTGTDFERHLSGLVAAQGQPRGLVIDLRSNPGGLLSAAVDVADSLLDSGGIVSTRGRLPASDTHFEASSGQLVPGSRIVVLVDGASASASEVLAGALRDNGRACVAGSPTFGKGSVQTVLTLDNGDSIKLTTARYYTPSGRSIQGVGITPDLDLSQGADSAASGIAVQGMSESGLAGHLVGEEEETGGEVRQGGVLLPGEAILGRALDYLKAMDPATCQAPDLAGPVTGREAEPAPDGERGGP